MLKKGDSILAAVLVVVIAISYGGVEMYRRAGDKGHRIAVVKQNNVEIKRIDLDAVTEPQRFKVGGKYNNYILVENGRIRYEDADCPDKLCVKTGWQEQNGDASVCLPNQTIVKIEGENKNVDGVAF
ncbi:MAG: hypothetical protein K0R31_2523 [Clostridiales bacterium]|jgi:hypothetical protein|nr:hypothetical protein [Clostridiales bacterium]